MNNRNVSRADSTKNPQPIDHAMGKRVKEVLDKKFGNVSNREIGDQIGPFSESAVRSWKRGEEIMNSKALAILAKDGVDIHWILTGERQENRVPLPDVDHLDQITDNPDCPNSGLCRRLASIVQLQRLIASPKFVEGVSEELVGVAMLALAKHRAAPIRKAAMESFEQGPVVDAAPEVDAEKKQA